jgi:hypothetical protein
MAYATPAPSNARPRAARARKAGPRAPAGSVPAAAAAAAAVAGGVPPFAEDVLDAAEAEPGEGGVGGGEPCSRGACRSSAASVSS